MAPIWYQWKADVRLPISADDWMMSLHVQDGACDSLYHNITNFSFLLF